MTSRRKEIFFVALCVVFSALFTIGCSDSLLHPAQDGARILVQLENSSLRSGDTPSPTEKWQGNAWIENRDGSESHHQNFNSASGEEASLTFDNLVIGSEINIHLELTKNDDSQTKLTGESGWITVNEGTNVVVIVLREDSDTGEIDDPVAGDDSDTGEIDGPVAGDDSDTGEIDGPVAGDDPEDEGDPVLSRIEAQYDSKQYQLVNTNIEPSKITITQHFDNGSTKVVKASEVSNDYTIAFAANASINSSIGNVPATVTHVKTQITADFTIPVKYTLDASNLTINGSTSVEQNGTLELVANYSDTTYHIHESDGSTKLYTVKDNLNISWKDATAQDDAWKAMAETSNAGTGKTATVTLTPTDEWCVTTGGITASHTYTVTAITASIGDIVYSDGTVSTSLNSGKTPVGIVIKTTNSQPTLILALNNGATTELTYSKAEEACSNYGTTCGDGKTTWRIPSATEWKDVIYANQDKIQSALTTAGGSQMGTGYFYWTSDNYQRIILSSGTLNRADRSDPENATTTHARFVRDWQ